MSTAFFLPVKIAFSKLIYKKIFRWCSAEAVRLVCCFRKFTKGGHGRRAEEVCSLYASAETLCHSVAPCRFSLPQTPALFASPVAVAVLLGEGDTQVGATNLCRFSRCFASQKPATSGRNLFQRRANFIGQPFYIPSACISFLIGEPMNEHVRFFCSGLFCALEIPGKILSLRDCHFRGFIRRVAPPLWYYGK